MLLAKKSPTRVGSALPTDWSPHRQATFDLVLIEGNDDDANRIRRLLARCDRYTFRVRRFRDLADARPVLAEECPDCVLVDLDLPDSKGLPTLSHVLGLSSSPVVVLVDEQLGDTRAHALRSSAIGFQCKTSATSDALAAAVTDAVDEQDRLIDLRVRAHRPRPDRWATSTLLRDASLDPVTRALNRRAIIAALDRELRNPWHSIEVLGVVHLRIGALAGRSVDAVALRAAERRIAAAVRTTDHVARAGTADFVIVAPHLPERDALDALVDRVERSLADEVPEEPALFGAVSIGRSAATIGHACVVTPPLPHLLLTSAELAMDEARRSVGNHRRSRATGSTWPANRSVS